MLEIVVGVLTGLVLGQIGSWAAKMLSRTQAQRLYRKGWDAAVSAHEKDVEPVGEGLYDEHHPNPLHIPIGSKISFYMPYSGGPTEYAKTDSSTFKSVVGDDTLTINDLADAEIGGGVWRLVE